MTIKQALQGVVNNPVPATDVVLDMKVYELVARALFDVANSPDARVKGSITKATRAQKLIFNRLVGLRRPGTHPAARKTAGISFVDLTIGVIE